MKNGRGPADKDSSPLGSNQPSVLRVVVPYILFGAAWILFSDRLVLPLAGDAEDLLWLSTAKGWFFIVVTASILYALVLREMRRRSELETRLFESLAEKEALLAEVHHRVKNNLQVMASILNLEREVLEGEEARLMNRLTRARLRSMSLVHEQLYDSAGIARIDLAKYLKNLVANLSDILEVKRADYDYNLAEVGAKPDTAIPFGLFATEALTNALRHGADAEGRREIRIELRPCPGGQGELVIRDRGAGLPEGEAREGLGFRLMGALADQLRGSFSVVNEGGAVVRLRFSTEGGGRG
jgi:two-component sensor histidine kinase